MFGHWNLSLSNVQSVRDGICVNQEVAVNTNVLKMGLDI